MKSHFASHTGFPGRWMFRFLAQVCWTTSYGLLILSLSPLLLLRWRDFLHDSLCIWAARGYYERRSTFNLPSTSNLTMQDFVRIWGFSLVQWGKVDLKVCQKNQYMFILWETCHSKAFEFYFYSQGRVLVGIISSKPCVLLDNSLSAIMSFTNAF